MHGIIDFVSYLLVALRNKIKMYLWIAEEVLQKGFGMPEIYISTVIIEGLFVRMSSEQVLPGFFH
jgi:hypothetical protein